MRPNDPRNHVVTVNARLAQGQAQGLLNAALRRRQFGRTALVSSFGAEAAVLLHMVAQIAPDTPVLFIDTRLLFEETLRYQQELSAKLGLSDVRTLRSDAAKLTENDPGATLHQIDPDGCCALRKTIPLQSALNEFDAWISGRKRFQGGARSDLNLVEIEPHSSRIKLNPLANWTSDDIRSYARAHDLPPHPLVARGYGSIGCAPCTVPAEGRQGRWRGQDKTECGIHFENGRTVRKGATA